jgi:hypothetical protein
MVPDTLVHPGELRRRDPGQIATHPNCPFELFM